MSETLNIKHWRKTYILESVKRGGTCSDQAERLGITKDMLQKIIVREFYEDVVHLEADLKIAKQKRSYV